VIKIKDSFIVQLFFFSVVVIGLFSYLFFLENSKSSYENYKNNLNKMVISNLFINNFLEKRDKFINFDTIVFQTNKFENSLKDILKKDVEEEFGEEFYLNIKKIKALFLKKTELVERFKSRQASLLNSLYYIYELNHLLPKDIKSKKKKLFEEITFLIMQEFIKIEKNEKDITNLINKLEKQNRNHLTDKDQLFIVHSKKFIENLNFLEKLKVEIYDLNLLAYIQKSQLNLEKIYNGKLKYQFFIAFSFFILIIIILYLMYKQHIKAKKVKSELAAFKYAVENSDNSIVLTDAKKNILYVNDNFEKITGYQKDDVFGQTPEVLGSGDTPQEVYDDLNTKLDNGDKWEGEFVNKKKDGTLFYEKASIVPIKIDGKITNYLAIKLDITEYIEQSEELKLSAAIFENIKEGILICGADKKILTVNRSFESILGYSKSELIGEKPSLFKSGFHDFIFYKKMWQDIKDKGSWKGKVYDKKKSGEMIPIWLNISAIKNNNGEISRYIAVHTSLQEIIKSQKKAEFLAYHDSLTSLPNRLKLESDLEYTINIATRNELEIFVLFIDLDRFKIINDTLGHGIGDELLKIVGNRIKSVLRETDILARMGGDEFIVVLDTSRNKKGAGFVCEKILNIIKEPIIIEGNNLNTTASIGIAVFPEDGRDITSLIKNADTAMYYAKKLGKNNYQFYDEKLSLDVHAQLKIEQALKSAISNNEFYLNYQPQYNLVTQEVSSFEALVRWQSKDLGYVRPDKFIPIAEDNGMIYEIGKFVFEQACIDFVEFKKVNKNLKYIAINISSVQFKDKNFVNDIFYIVCRYNLKPSEIELEVTERYVMEYSQSNLNTMDELRDLGFRFSIDDFGTGYSSMGYLTKFPIDIIKVDKSFIDGTPDDNNNVQIVKAIVVLSKSLGFSVVAEGIEYKEQEKFLQYINCNLGQGYLFSKPLSFKDTLTILEK